MRANRSHNREGVIQFNVHEQEPPMPFFPAARIPTREKRRAENELPNSSAPSISMQASYFAQRSQYQSIPTIPQTSQKLGTMPKKNSMQYIYHGNNKNDSSQKILQGLYRG